MTLGARIAQLERMIPAAFPEGGAAVGEVLTRLQDRAARIAETGGIVDPATCSLADLYAVWFAGAAAPGELDELARRLRQIAAEDPEGRTPLGSLAAETLATGGGLY